MDKTTFKKFRWLYITGLTLSSLGILDTVYLTAAHYTQKVTLACPTTTFINCEKVTTSSYSMVFGIPVALLGLVFFVVMFGLQMPQAWRSVNKYIRQFRLLVSVVGLLSIFWLIFVEFHRLNSICLFCTAVHVLTFALFVLTLIGTSLTAEAIGKHKQVNNKEQ